MALSHQRVWAAIDELASRYGMSPSGLAKRNGLDSTAFNKSKRHSADGRPRWAFAQSAWAEADLTQRYYTPVAECLGCPPPVALTSEVGTARIHLQDVSPEPPAGSNPALIQLSLDGDDFLRETTLRLLSGPIQPSGE